MNTIEHWMFLNNNLFQDVSLTPSHPVPPFRSQQIMNSGYVLLNLSSLNPWENISNQHDCVFKCV